MPPSDPSSYILPDDVSRQIFTASILPAEFPSPASTPSVSSPPPDRTPLAVLIVGQTGAGKTRTAPLILSALGRLRNNTTNAPGTGAPPTVAHFIADTFKAHHPSYAALSARYSHFASRATGPDARRWLGMAVAEGIARRVDVLLESACRHPSDFSDLACAFHGGGYRVEVVMLAVPAALSRLGILTRYYQRLPEAGSRGLPVRLTPRRVHDDSYAGLLASAEWIDESDAVDQVLVVRRGNLVAFGSERVDGKFAASVRDVLGVERKRPITVDEARTAREDVARLEGVEAAAEDLEEIRRYLEAPAEKDAVHSEEFPVLRPLLFPDMPAEGERGTNTLSLGL